MSNEFFEYRTREEREAVRKRLRELDFHIVHDTFTLKDPNGTRRPYSSNFDYGTIEGGPDQNLQRQPRSPEDMGLS